MSRRPLPRWMRRLHRWGTVVVAVPFLVILVTGILLQWKKSADWIQPPSQRGVGTAPVVSFEAILAAARTAERAGIRSWEDVDRLDVRPGRGVVKVRGHDGWEVQVDTETAEVLHVAQRRSDLIEALHDGSWFHEAATLWVFFPVALVVLGLWVTGLYLFYLPYGVRWRRRHPPAGAVDGRPGTKKAVRPDALRILAPLLLVLPLLGATCRPDASMSPSTYHLYVGTATGDAAEGIYTFALDAESGALRRVHGPEPTLNPSYLTLAPDGHTLYSVSETAEGRVRAYRVEPATGRLSLLDERPSGGAGPAYVSTDASGRWLVVANYGGGSVALLPVEKDGRLGEGGHVVQHEARPARAGIDASRQSAPHAHYAHFDPANRRVLVVDLGLDQVRAYPLDAEVGRLREEAVATYEAPPGTGPRHLAFAPDGRHAYLVGELDGTVTVLDYDAGSGRMRAVQTLSALPPGFEGANKSADVHVHPSGRWLYVSNRGDADGLAVFAVDAETGRLMPAGYQREGLRWPRQFALDPTGTLLVAANRRADQIAVFRIDAETGGLMPTGHTAEVPEPTVVAFAPARE